MNSLSIDFVENKMVLKTEEAIFSGGCFWGVQSLFDALDGVLKTEVGYIGGHLKNPTYETVCSGNTGHLEGVRVIFDCEKLNYAQLVKYFFEIHNPTEKNKQGPDIGEQYTSAIFYFNDAQKKIAEELINQLVKNNLTIQTKLNPTSVFWKAEEYHQNYYKKTGGTPYCHRRVKRF